MPNTTLLGSTPPPPHEADLFLMTLGEAAEINLFLVKKNPSNISLFSTSSGGPPKINRPIWFIFIGFFPTENKIFLFLPAKNVVKLTLFLTTTKIVENN
jgi:hypothetical protein